MRQSRWDARRSAGTLLGALVLMLVAGALPAGALPAGTAPETTQRYLVTVTPGADGRSFAAATARSHEPLTRVLRGFTVEASPAEVARLRADRRVLRVEPDVELRSAAVQSPATWGLDRIDQATLPLDGRYQYEGTGRSVRAYIVDTGIRAHNEFGTRLVAGWTAINDGRGTDDCAGHGTHVAGTVGGTTYGAAKEVTLVPVRVLDCDGAGRASDLLHALDWILAQPRGPAVVNMSFSTSAGTVSPTLEDAIRRVVAAGITVVGAAGNQDADACTVSPARVPEILTVAASTPSDTRAWFSNTGSCVDLFAPGTSITSAGITGSAATATMAGTSMAAPHVAGVAAQHLERTPSATPAAVAQAILADATSGVVGGAGTAPNLLLRAALPLPAPGALPADGWSTSPPAAEEPATGSSPQTEPAPAPDPAPAPEPVPVESAPVESAPVEPAPVEPAPSAPPAFDGDPTTLEHIATSDTVATAIALSTRRFRSHDALSSSAALLTLAPDALLGDASAAHVVLSRDDAFPDSLAGAPLTGDGPLLFTGTNILPVGTTAELLRVLAPGRTVYLLGGDVAIAPAVAIQVAELGYRVVRLAGASRVETALRVADEVRRRHPDAGEVLIARAYGAEGNETSGWADSVTGGAYGAAAGVPVLLTAGSALHPALAEWLRADGPSRSIVLGGAGAVSDAVLAALPSGIRVAGPERAATAAAIATELWGDAGSGPRRYIVLNGFDRNGWAHGLASAGIAADAGAPLLLVTPEVPAATAGLIASCGDPQLDLLLVGGSAIPTSTIERLAHLDGGAC